MLICPMVILNQTRIHPRASQVRQNSDKCYAAIPTRKQQRQ